MYQHRIDGMTDGLVTVNGNDTSVSQITVTIMIQETIIDSSLSHGLY